jgi:hypothetical protein
MFTKRDIIEMCYRPSNPDQSILDILKDQIVRWPDEKLIEYFTKITGSKLYKLGSQFVITF